MNATFENAPSSIHAVTARAAFRWMAAAALGALAWGTALEAEESPRKAEAGETASPCGEESGWKTLFDGKTMKGWNLTDFAGHGEVRVDKDQGWMIFEAGLALTGVTYTNPLPKVNYEICLEAMKIQGSDFFCGLTFPVKDSHCSFIAGGWGGGVVGISSIDGMDAAENETTNFMRFENDHWYRIRVRVTSEKIQAWIDGQEMVDQSIVDRRIEMRPGEIELSVPFGLATFQTKAAMRDIQVRELPPKAAKD